MWYEILPTYIVITTCLAVPSLFTYFSNQLLLSQPFRRNLGLGLDNYMYCRDSRISGRNWAYDFKGLENIPDMDQPQKPVKQANC